VLLPIAWITRVIVPADLSHVGDRQRDALRARPAPNDDELPGPADLGDSRSLDDEASYVGRQLRPGDYRVHLTPEWMVSRECCVIQYEL